MLTVIDEFTRRCMAVVVERRLNSDNVLHCLTELFVQHGPPDHIRSDNGSEFTAHAVRDWLGRIGVKTLYIEPGSPWENGYNESFNSKLRDVNGGGIMLHARRPGGPVAAAQNCATHGPLAVATRGRRCTGWSSMRRFDWRLSTRV